MLARAAALVALVLAGCASTQRNLDNYKMTRPGDAPLYVGRSQSGEPVLAASHYHAMTGLATTDQDLGLAARKAGDGEMLCAREMPTGTHVPRWTCRYERDIEQGRRNAQDWLDRPELSLGYRRGLSPLSTGRGTGPGGGVAP